MATSPVLGIPYIATQQSQPEVTHNEALNALQIMLAGGAITRNINTPPGSPSEGDVYILGSSPTGAWAGRANCIAGYFSDSWIFVPGNDDSGTPITMGADQDGLRLWVQDEDAIYVWSNLNTSPEEYQWQELTIQAVPAADYGLLDVSNNTTTIAVTAAVDTTLASNSDYTQITGIFDAVPHGENNGVTQGTNSLTVGADGVYNIFVWSNMKSDTNGTTVGLKFAVNGVIGTSRRPKSLMPASGDYDNVSAEGFIQLAAGDVITLYHAADKTCNLTYEDMVFGLKELRRL